MKKIIIAIILVLSFAFLCSCNGNTNTNSNTEPVNWGPTYGNQSDYKGFQICLRTDGYYQIVGFQKEALKNNNLFIPQYIKGKQVMGFGANVYVFQDGYAEYDGIHHYTLYQSVFELGHDIKLEYKRTGFTCYYKIDGSLAFYSNDPNCEGINKVYANCHHVNPLKGKVFPEDQLFLDNTETPFVSDDLQYYVDIDYRTMFSAGRSYDGFEYFAGDVSGYLNNVYDCIEYNKRKKLYNDATERHIEEYIAYCKEFNLNMSTNFPDCNADSYDSPEFYIYCLEKFHKRCPFNALCANVEFYYNLTIDGVEYHNVNRPESNVYCFDYINDNEKIINPLDPYAEGYKFLGWYTEPECTNKFDFSTKVKAVDGEQLWLKLYAKWEKE